MRDALVNGTTDPEVVAELARGKMRPKIPALREALEGQFEPLHAVLISAILQHIDFLDQQIQEISDAIAEPMRPFVKQAELLCTIPGVQKRTAEILIAEIGVDMSVFPTAGHVASWAGQCPGNDQSAGKRRSRNTRKGSKHLNAALTDAAMAALPTRYQRDFRKGGARGTKGLGRPRRATALTDFDGRMTFPYGVVSPSMGSRDGRDIRPRNPNERRRRGDAMCGRLARAYGETMRTGDPAAAVAVIDDALRHKLSAAAIQSRVIAPAMCEIGKLWERGGLTVAQEHLASAVSYHVLTRLYPGLLRQSTRQGDTVVVAAVHGEHHVLGLRMVADVLDGAGFDVRFLGADVPEASLLAWVQEHEPAVVALGVTMPLGAATLARQLQTLRDVAPDVELVIGGQGVPAVLRQGAGVLYAADTEQLTEYLDSSLKTPAPGELPRGIARGGVGFGRYAGLPNDATDGLAARMAQTTAAAADAARGQARRAFVLEQLAFRDPLTELWNRRAFDDRFQELTFPGALHPPAIVMIDVDHFKSINDGFGHEAGDRALIGVARGILGALRPGDFAARYGGDEFAVLLPDTPRSMAATIGERIRSRIESSMTEPPLTVSVGVSVPEHTDRRRASLDVDQALYTAKEHGRNQVVFA